MEFVEYYLFVSTAIIVSTIYFLARKMFRTICGTEKKFSGLDVNGQIFSPYGQIQAIVEFEIQKIMYKYNIYEILTDRTLSTILMSDKEKVLEEKFRYVERRLHDLEKTINENGYSKAIVDSENGRRLNKMEQMIENLKKFQGDQTNLTTNIQNDMRELKQNFINQKRKLDDYNNEMSEIKQANLFISNDIRNIRSKVGSGYENSKHFNLNSLEDLNSKYKFLKSRITNIENDTMKSINNFEMEFQILKSEMSTAQKMIQQEVSNISRSLHLRPIAYSDLNVFQSGNEHFESFLTGRNNQPSFHVNNAAKETITIPSPATMLPVLNSELVVSSPPPLPPPPPSSTSSFSPPTPPPPPPPPPPPSQFLVCRNDGNASNCPSPPTDPQILEEYPRVQVTREMLKSVKLKAPSKEPRPPIKIKPLPVRKSFNN